MFRVKNNSTGKYLDQGHLQYYFLRSDGVLWKQMHRNGNTWMEPAPKRYTAEMLMINHCRGDQVMPLYENDKVYVAGHGVCVVQYNRDECMWVLEDVNTGEEYLYQDIIEDIEKIIDPEEQEDQ
jgi:uncharacterized protein YkuJ